MDSETPETCLLCNRIDGLKRGLCVTHYSRFNEQRKRLPVDKRKEFEQLLEAAGKLLPVGKPGKKVESNPFAELAAKLLSVDEMHATVAETQSRYNDADREVKKAQTEAKATDIPDSKSKTTKRKKSG